MQSKLQYFGQEEFLLAESDPFTAQDYADALVRGLHKVQEVLG